MSAHQLPPALQPASSTTQQQQSLPNETPTKKPIQDQMLAGLLVQAQANPVIDTESGKSMEYRELLRHPKYKKAWNISAANEFGRLAQGIGGRIKGTNTIYFIHPSKIPYGRIITYGRFVCQVRPQKEEENRTRLTVGGNLITDYPGSVTTKTADMVTVKCHINSTLSTPNAKAVCMDIKNMYLGTPLDRWEFMKIAITDIPEEVIKEYNLRSLVKNGYVYVEIRRGMYGLPQAGILANKLLAKRLAKHGYCQTKHTPGLWRHRFRPVSFTLIVDDFLVKYVGREQALHLKNAIETYYEATTDWDANLYGGVHIKWDYENRDAYLSMPGYITSARHKFHHKLPAKPQHAPHKAKTPQYGVKVQMTDPPDETPKCNKQIINLIQQIIGCVLFYGRAIDSTLLTALSTLSSEQAQATEQTKEAVDMLLDYCATHPDAVLRYMASDMILKVHSDGSYLSETKARSRAGAHFYLGNNNDKLEINNGAILNIAAIIKNVMSAASEAELSALFQACKEAVPIRIALEEMGHPQPATPVQVDNSTACGIVNDTVKQTRSSHMDMRFYWVRDRINQGQFHVYWAPAALNLADYFTKHHPPTHHQRMRPIYLYTKSSPRFLPMTGPTSLRGCVDPRTRADPLTDRPAPSLARDNRIASRSPVLI
jgi:hypothetical protein